MIVLFHLGDFHMLIVQCVIAVGSEPQVAQVVLHMFSLWSVDVDVCILI